MKWHVTSFNLDLLLGPTRGVQFNLIINQSAIVMYRLYHVALLGEEEMNPFLTAPKVLFDGLNEKGEPNL